MAVLPGPGSSWTTQDDDYSLFEFYTGSADKKGHSKVTRVSIPPQVKGELSAMLASRRWPYATEMAFVRDAIVHRLRWLADHEDAAADREAVRAAVSRVIHEDRVANMRIGIQANRDLLHELEDVALLAIQQADTDALESIIAQAQSIAVVEREPYASRFNDLAERLTRKLLNL